MHYNTRISRYRWYKIYILDRVNIPVHKNNLILYNISCLAILVGTTTAGGGAASANWFSIRLSVFVFPSARRRALSSERLIKWAVLRRVWWSKVCRRRVSLWRVPDRSLLFICSFFFVFISNSTTLFFRIRRACDIMWTLWICSAASRSRGYFITRANATLPPKSFGLGRHKKLVGTLLEN